MFLSCCLFATTIISFINDSVNISSFADACTTISLPVFLLALATLQGLQEFNGIMSKNKALNFESKFGLARSRFSLIVTFVWIGMLEEFCAVFQRKLWGLEMVSFREVSEGIGGWFEKCVSVCPHQFGQELNFLNF